jgi:hypothetical protein
MDAADAEDAAVVAAEADATVPDECREHAKALVACGQLCEVNIDEYRCAQKIKSMSVAEAKQYWRLFVQYISEELLKVDNNRAAAAAAGRPSEDYSHGCSADSSEGLQACSASLHNGWACPTNRRLEALVKRHSQMCKFVAFFNPGVLYRMFEGTVEEEGGAEADPGEEHWRRVVGHIGLTAPQVRGWPGAVWVEAGRRAQQAAGEGWRVQNVVTGLIYPAPQAGVVSCAPLVHIPPSIVDSITGPFLEPCLTPLPPGPPPPPPRTTTCPPPTPQLEDMLAHGELYQQKLWEILVQRGELQRRLAQVRVLGGSKGEGQGACQCFCYAW